MLVIHWQWQVHIPHFTVIDILLWKTWCTNSSIPDFQFADIPGEDGHTRNSSTTSQTGSAGYSSSQSSHGTTAQVSLNSFHFYMHEGLSKTSHLKTRLFRISAFDLLITKSTFSPAARAPIKAQQWWFEYTTKVLRKGTQASGHWSDYFLYISQLACVEVRLEPISVLLSADCLEDQRNLVGCWPPALRRC